MSHYFEIDGDTVWNPSSRTGRLFIAIASSLESYLDMPTGLRQRSNDPDAYDVDLGQFRLFVESLRNDYASTSNPVYRSLIENVLAISLAMLARTGTPFEQRSELEAQLVATIEAMQQSMPR